MSLDPIPKRLFDLHVFVSKPIFSIRRGHGQSKISAILVITAVAIATTLTILLVRETIS